MAYLSFTARQLSLMVNVPDNNQGQSSRSKHMINNGPMTLHSESPMISLATVEDLAWSETLPSPMRESEEIDGTIIN